MWALRGTFNSVYQERIDEPFKNHYSEEIVALFSTRDKADAYIKKNRLKNPIRESFAAVRAFRKNSLLADCEGATVEPYDAPDYPVDPE